jgi:hypothetical protein
LGFWTPKLDLFNIAIFCSTLFSHFFSHKHEWMDIYMFSETGIVVLSTVVPTSFAGVDSFDKTRFRLIARHLPISLRETETGGKGDISPFHLIAQR